MKSNLNNAFLLGFLSLTLASFGCSSGGGSEDGPDSGYPYGGTGGGGGGGGGEGGGEMENGGSGDDGGGETGGDPGSSGGGDTGGGGTGGAGGTGGQPIDTSCVKPDSANSAGTNVWDDTLGQATVVVDNRDSCQRTYTLSTTAALRDPGFPGSTRTVQEAPGGPTLRSGHDMFDALYALTMLEVRENSVDTIKDWGFNNNNSVACGTGGCFETGREWHYVWTRDTAYAVDLGLAGIDPPRSKNSLEFKLSELRGGGGMQVVQDTGTGGSYPVSTDRVVWAVGAWELLRQLDGDARTAFRDKALVALRNTIEHDREVVFDASDGLYRGEQSFLDWRENTYPGWTANNVVHIGMSKSLGTNLLHYRALDLLSTLSGEVGDNTARDKYRGFADSLSSAIKNRLWSEAEGLFSTYTTTALDPSATRRYDLLGSALAVLFGVATPAQAEKILSKYPHYGPGAPVIWPQQQDTRIYHNRGEWPFVTAYWLRAAKTAGNDAVANKMVHALIRGTAINLSNMENFEAATGAARLADGDYTGPVVNSQRQLWSVAGFLSMVHHTLFGIEAEDNGLRVKPFIPASLRTSIFAGTQSAVLNHLPYRGRSLTVVLHFPTSAGTGALTVQSIKLNDQAVSGDFLPISTLAAKNRVDVVLGAGSTPNASIKVVSDANWQSVFGPKTPTITAVDSTSSGVRLTISTAEASDVSLRIYRDKVMVADSLPGNTTSWIDTGVDPAGATSPCYAVEATFSSSGNHSQHSAPNCWWGTGNSHITEIPATSLANVGGVLVNEHGRFHYSNWGDEGHTLTVPEFVPSVSGPYLVQVEYGNGAGPIDTGITCAVKRVMVQDKGTNAAVGSGYLMMPHLGKDEWNKWSSSNFVEVNLVAGKAYRIVVGSGERASNMSYFKHFEAYTGGLGGSGGVFNRVNISHVKILAKSLP